MKNIIRHRYIGTTLVKEEETGDIPPEYLDSEFSRKILDGISPVSNRFTIKRNYAKAPVNEVNEDSELLRKLNGGLPFG